MSKRPKSVRSVPVSPTALDNYDTLSVKKLRDFLRQRGLTVGGSKSVLIERLRQDDAEERTERQSLEGYPSLDSERFNVSQESGTTPRRYDSEFSRIPFAVPVVEDEDEEEIIEERDREREREKLLPTISYIEPNSDLPFGIPGPEEIRKVGLSSKVVLPSQSTVLEPLSQSTLDLSVSTNKLPTPYAHREVAVLGLASLDPKRLTQNKTSRKEGTFYSIEEMKTILRQLGLPQKGKKSEMYSNIMDSLRKSGYVD